MRACVRACVCTVVGTIAQSWEFASVSVVWSCKYCRRDLLGSRISIHCNGGRVSNIIPQYLEDAYIPISINTTVLCYKHSSRCLWFVCVEHVECSEEIQFPAPLLKHVGPSQSLGGVHQRLLHTGRVDVGVVDSTEKESHRPGNDGGSHTGATEGAATSVEGGASNTRAVGDNVWLYSTVASRQLLYTRIIQRTIVIDVNCCCR